MPPVTRGIVQRMSDVALEIWREAARSYVRAEAVGTALGQADEELDILSSGSPPKWARRIWRLLSQLR
jgi:hypothetical protein